MNIIRDLPARLLFTWARWLALRHPTIRFVNSRLPLLGVALTLCVIAAFPAFNFAGDGGLVTQTNGLLQALAPFFVAALALVAGFPGDSLDKPMGGMPPFIIVEGEQYFPSRRELLGYLFAYLAGASVFVYMLGAIVLSMTHPHYQPLFVFALHARFGPYVIALCKAIYAAALFHLFAVTFLGLHFLGNFMTTSRLGRSTPPQPSSPLTPIDAPAAIAPQRRSRGVAPRNHPAVAPKSSAGRS